MKAALNSSWRRLRHTNAPCLLPTAILPSLPGNELKRELHLEQRQAWREFVTERALAGDEAAISALRGLRYREQWRERAPEREVESPYFALRGIGDYEPRFVRDLRDVEARAERNGEVSYHWRKDDSEAFRDRGPEIAFRDTGDVSLAAGLELACAKWGNTVTLHGSIDYKERALAIAIDGMHVDNPELQERQRKLVVAQERTRDKEREFLRGRERAPAQEIDRSLGGSDERPIRLRKLQERHARADAVRRSEYVAY